MTTAPTSVTVANRALQKCGVGADGRIASFTEDSKNASAIALCYDPLRQAELRRNFWTFSLKRAVLRQITPATDKLFTFPAYASGTTFDIHDIATSGGIWYKSKVAGNIGNAVTNTTYWEVWNGPLVAPVYDSTIAWYPGELVYSGTSEYIVIAPLAAGATPVEGTTWHEFDTTGAVTTSATPYTAPLTGRTYAYNIPRDFLRLAPKDPRYSMPTDEYLIENGQIVSDFAGPLFIRYVRDEEDVSKFDHLFTEGLAARIGFEVCEEVTQSSAKKADLREDYKQQIGDARLVNAIEAGPIESDEDEWVSVRNSTNARIGNIWTQW